MGDYLEERRRVLVTSEDIRSIAIRLLRSRSISPNKLEDLALKYESIRSRGCPEYTGITEDMSLIYESIIFEASETGQISSGLRKRAKSSLRTKS